MPLNNWRKIDGRKKERKPEDNLCVCLVLESVWTKIHCFLLTNNKQKRKRGKSGGITTVHSFRSDAFDGHPYRELIQWWVVGVWDWVSLLWNKLTSNILRFKQRSRLYYRHLCFVFFSDNYHIKFRIRNIWVKRGTQCEESYVRVVILSVLWPADVRIYIEFCINILWYYGVWSISDLTFASQNTSTTDFCSQRAAKRQNPIFFSRRFFMFIVEFVFISRAKCSVLLIII